MAVIKKVHEILNDIVGSPVAEHTLVYDSSTETLEPVYFFIIDLMNDMGLAPKKLVDNFSSSPGSGHFSEFGGKATAMQQQGQKILADVNTVLRSVINILYDLRDFKMRLQQYEDIRSDDEKISNAALLSLKQIWLDKVDMQKGGSAIKMLATQAGFGGTLIDVFLVSKDEKDVDKIDVNERFKRVIKPRIAEFNIWLEQSEKEIRKRYKIEKAYLRSQVNSLKLYSRWARPYLEAALKLEQLDLDKSPELVTAFNTLILQLTIWGKSEVKPEDFVTTHEITSDFGKLKLKRKYYKCVLIDFKFRGMPQRIPQGGYVTGGKVDIIFRGYALNEDELAKFDEEIDKSDIKDVLALIKGTTEESLENIQDEINEYLNEDEDKIEKEQKKKESSRGTNPFVALIGGYNKPKETKKSTKKEKEITIRKENWGEKEYLRPLTKKEAKDITFTLFNIYKKAHGMPNYD